MNKPITIIFILGFVACAPKSSEFIVDEKDSYSKQHTIWQNQRIKSLTATEGWLSVIGLSLLKEGKNTIGSRSDMDIRLPEFASSVVGQIHLSQDSFFFESAGESYTTVNGERFLSGKMNTQDDGVLTKIRHKSIIFYVIKRGDKYGLRIKNTLAKARYSLKEIPSFPINYNLIHEATVKDKRDDGEMLSVEDITGSKQDYIIQAELTFVIKKRKLSLLAFDGGPDFYFVIFKDRTTGNETYGGGRYMYVKRPKESEEKAILDFNRAFNPPCVFTLFATCPIPPQRNFLDVDIKAGEKAMDSH